MKMILTHLALTAMWFAASYADSVSVPDYVRTKKSDIDNWQNMMINRILTGEQLMISGATNAIQYLNVKMEFSLSQTVVFPSQELVTALALMAGTNAEGCVKGIAYSMPDSITHATDTYRDCTADAVSKLNRLSSSLQRINASSTSSYLRAISGIDMCAKTYPNKDSINRLVSCVNSMSNTYFAAADSTKKSLEPSPTLSYFIDTVISCARSAAETVSDQGKKFLGMLGDCAALSGGAVDVDEYKADLAAWQGCNDTLLQQIEASISIGDALAASFDQQIIDLYNLEKFACEQYVLQPRGLDYYKGWIYIFLSAYFNSITETQMDNPSLGECTDIANVTLDAIVNQTAITALSCDVRIANDSWARIGDIHQMMSQMKDWVVKVRGDRIFDCIVFPFRENDLLECFKQGADLYILNKNEFNRKIEQHLGVVRSYLENRNSTSGDPCGNSTLLPLAIWKAESVLLGARRCLYNASGSTYDVTTPATHSTPAYGWL